MDPASSAVTKAFEPPAVDPDGSAANGFSLINRRRTAELKIAFTLPHAEDTDLGIYDLSGRLVRSLQHGRLAAGTHRFAWDARDDTGRRVAAGVYFVHFDAAARHLEAKRVRFQ